MCEWPSTFVHGVYYIYKDAINLGQYIDVHPSIFLAPAIRFKSRLWLLHSFFESFRGGLALTVLHWRSQALKWLCNPLHTNRYQHLNVANMQQLNRPAGVKTYHPMKTSGTLMKHIIWQRRSRTENHLSSNHGKHVFKTTATKSFVIFFSTFFFMLKVAWFRTSVLLNASLL